MPERLQLSRKKGFRLPPNAKSVARPSRWGNPWAVRRDQGTPTYWFVAGPAMILSGFTTERAATEVAVHLFRMWVNGEILGYDKAPEGVHELRGFDLACYCPPPEPGEIDWCHARVLLEIANG